MGKIVKYRMQLEVLTAVHIAGADYKSKLDKKEYVFDKDKGTLTLVDSEKFVTFLIKKNLFDEYISYIEKNLNSKKNEQDKNIKLINFLKDKDIYKNIEEFRKKASIKIDADIEEMNDIKLMLRTIEGKTYIPGSSIKGALINFLLVDYIINHRNEFEKEKKIILDTAKKVSNKDEANLFRNNIIKNIVNVIEDYILYSRDKEYSVKKRIKNNKEEEYISYKRSPEKKLGILISDSYSHTDIKTTFYQDIDENIKKKIENKEYERKMPVVREYINKNSKFEFDITIDFDILSRSKLKIKNMEDLISKLENATDYLLKYTLNLNIENQNLILGANTGFHQKTIVHALFENKKERLEVIKKILHKGSKNVIGNHLNDTFSPRVINRIKIADKLELAGLVEIKKLEEKE